MTSSSSLIDLFINDFIKKLFIFRGTTPRGLYLFVNLILSIMIIAIQATTNTDATTLFSTILALSYLPITIRRFRDTGKSFWHLCWLVVPLIGWLYLLYLLFLRTSSSLTIYSQPAQTRDRFAFNLSLVGLTIITIPLIYYPSIIGMEDNEAPVASIFKYLHENPDPTSILEYFTESPPQPIIDLLWAQTQFYAPVKSSFFNPINALKILTDMHYSQELQYSSFIDEMYIMTTLTHLPQNPLVKNPAHNESESKKYYNIINQVEISSQPERLELAKILLTIYPNTHIYNLFKGSYQNLPAQYP